jgi:hypothetical protein
MVVKIKEEEDFSKKSRKSETVSKKSEELYV